MNAVAAKDVAREHESWTREYWLCHCEGYRVQSSDGGFVGFVEEVFRSPGTGEPSALGIRTGVDGPGRVVRPVGMIREIRPDAELIVV